MKGLLTSAAVRQMRGIIPPPLTLLMSFAVGDTVEMDKDYVAYPSSTLLDPPQRRRHIQLQLHSRQHARKPEW